MPRVHPTSLQMHSGSTLHQYFHLFISAAAPRRRHFSQPLGLASLQETTSTTFLEPFGERQDSMVARFSRHTIGCGKHTTTPLHRTTSLQRRPHLRRLGRLPPATHVKWINIPSLVDKATRPIPPPATRATSTTPETVHINACHTGPQGNITAILQQGRLLPSILHFDANPGFFAQATRITHQSLHDNYEQARILHNTWKLAKNVHSIMVHLLAWGRGTKFTSGGEAHAMQLLQQGHGAVFHSNARCWVIHPHNAIVKGLAWSINATPPDL